MNDDKEGFFVCDCCHRTLPDEECFGVVYTDMNVFATELWCNDCGMFTEFVDEPFGHVEPSK